ncbi:MAG: hypothetical protein QOD10_1164 [Mycobacterium sp.]|jgi:hypothetical protein|nr:hypothetical protein [Mycobacterium sp.]
MGNYVTATPGELRDRRQSGPFFEFTIKRGREEVLNGGKSGAMWAH